MLVEIEDVVSLVGDMEFFYVKHPMSLNDESCDEGRTREELIEKLRKLVTPPKSDF